MNTDPSGGLDPLRAALAEVTVPAAEIEARLQDLHRRAAAPRPAMTRGRAGIHLAAAAAVFAVSVASLMTGATYRLERGRIRGPLEAGRELRAEEETVISIGSRVRVRMEAGSRLRLEGTAAAALGSGDAAFSVAPGTPFDVVTPAGTLTVRGTEFIVHVSKEESMQPSLSKVLVIVSSGLVSFSGPRGEAVARAGEGIRADAQEIRTVTALDELKRLEAGLAGREQALETLRQENDSAVLEAARRRQDETARKLEELEKRFDELAKDLDPETQMTAKMFIFKKKAALDFIAMQAKHEAHNAIQIKVRGIDPPESLDAGGPAGWEALEARIAAGLAQIQGLEVNTIDYEKLAALREATDEEALRELRNAVLARQRDASKKFYADLETTFSPAVRAFVEQQLQGVLGLKVSFQESIFAELPPSSDWWPPVERLLEQTDLRPFGQVSRVLLPSELDAIDREMKKAFEQEPEERRPRLAKSLRRFLGFLRYRTQVSMQIISLARKLAQ